MENATKALLIAGSILVVVLITAFGMSIFNQASDAGNTDEISSEMESGIAKGNLSILYNNIVSITGLPNGSIKKITRKEILNLAELVRKYNGKVPDEGYKIYLPFVSEKGYNKYLDVNHTDASLRNHFKDGAIYYFKVLGQDYEYERTNGRIYVKLGIFISYDYDKVKERTIKD